MLLFRIIIVIIKHWPDGASSNTSVSSVGGVRFKSRADQIFHKCQRLATAATLIVCLGAKRGDGHRSIVIPGRVLSEYNEDLILLILIIIQLMFY